MAVAELGTVVLDCPDPRALASFYAGVLGGTVETEGRPTGSTCGCSADGRWRSRPPPATYRRSGPRPTAPSSSIWT